MFRLKQKPLDEQEDPKFQNEKEDIQNEMEEQEKVDWQVLKRNYIFFNLDFFSLAATIEATCESGFQFFFQLSYLLPTILISVSNIRLTGDESGGSLEDLFNWRTASIAASFISISRTFCVIRLNN